MTTLHFEWLEVDLERQEIIEARVGDVVYSGATVQWSGFGRADRGWFFKRLPAIFGLWAPDVDAERWRLTGQLDDGDKIAYHLERFDGEAWRPLQQWHHLSETDRLGLLAELEELLAAVHGLLVIL